MYISLIIAILTYLLQSSRGASQSAALGSALAAGALTYGVTEYTDWGKDNLAPLDADIASAITGSVTNPDPQAIPIGDSSSFSTKWPNLAKWGGGLLTAGGVAAVTSSTWFLPVVLGLGAYLIVR